ncbi:MAG: dynamin family protein, partial [Actinomycetota bacterium]|nr:dynamin family protein [Actinomycetota bacterium]
MTESRALADLVGALVQLREGLDAVPLGLDGTDVDTARRTRTKVVGQLEDYVLPRLLQIDAPLLAVVGGSTGAGKSTLVNSLVRAPVSPVGVLRPTTHSPVVVHHPDDGYWFEGDRVLPNLARSTKRNGGPAAVQLVPHDQVPRGLALLDAPDVDSVDRANRELAEEILSAADLWLFVTSAARYADLVPWEVLGEAARRSTAVVVILDRTDPDDVTEVRGHLLRMMAARGLRDSPLFVVPEGRLDPDGLLPLRAVASIRNWLNDLADDQTGRGSIVEQSLLGTLRTVVYSSHEVADIAHEQAEASVRLRQVADAAVDEASAGAVAALADGQLVRGEIVTRWRELVDSGAGERWARGRGESIRRRLRGAVGGQLSPGERLEHAITDTLVAHVLEAVNTAHDGGSEAWSGDGAATGLLDQDTMAQGRLSRERRGRVESAITDWQATVGKAVAGVGRVVRPRDDSGEMQAGLTTLAQLSA